MWHADRGGAVLARTPRRCQTVGVGPAIMVVLLVVIIPVVVCMSGAIAAGGLGFLLKKETDEAFEGTELLTMGEQG